MHQFRIRKRDWNNIPAELAEALERKSRELGITQTEVLVMALENGLVVMNHPELQGESLRALYAKLLKARDLLDDASKQVLELGSTDHYGGKEGDAIVKNGS